MTIHSFANNGASGEIVAEMLGYLATAPDESDALAIYDFFFAPIRDADASEGALFLKRYLEGPQALWATFIAKTKSLPKLWSVIDAPDEALPFLQTIVGWTSELASITDRLTPFQLRRLISASAAIWNTRGPEDGIVNVIRFLTGARARVWSWFDFRFIIDETGTSEEHDGRDAWVVSCPGEPALDEYRSNVRVVDDGTGSLDRKLVVDVLGLLRPTGERFDVTWLAFLDEFEEAGDSFQWTGLVPDQVAAGFASLSDNAVAESAFVAGDVPATWSDLIAFARVRGSSSGAGVRFGLAVYAADDDNRYKVGLDIASNAVVLSSVVAGVESVLATVPPSVGALLASVWYGLRVVVFAEGPTNRVRVYLDGDLVIDTVNADLSQGGASVWHDDGATIDVDEVEVMLLPMVGDEIGP